MPRHFVSPSGYPIVVGRNANENHKISTEIVKGSDVWFHAADCPGAHVLLRLDKGDKVQNQDIEFCKSLATKFCKMPISKVTIAKGTDIAYIKGDPIGTITVWKTVQTMYDD